MITKAKDLCPGMVFYLPQFKVSCIVQIVFYVASRNMIQVILEDDGYVLLDPDHRVSVSGEIKQTHS